MDVKTICPYCGCGCSFYLRVEGSEVVGILHDSKDPISNGKPCIKGVASYQSVYSKCRVREPMIRKNGKLRIVSWDEAYRHIYTKTKGLKPNELAFYASSPASNEDCYLFQKFAREIFKTNNIDSCARLCHAATCYAFYESFGIMAMPSKFDDYLKADCILIIGSNPKSTYPNVFEKILRVQEQGAKLICVRDWKDETSDHADLFVELCDGTELAFLNGILNLLIERKAVDVKDSLIIETVSRYPKERVTKICNVKEGDLEKVADLIAKSKRFVLGYGMSLTQHSYGADNVFGAINLVLAKNGKIISMRGKTNIQGVGDMGCLPKQGDTFISSVFIFPVKALFVMESNPAQSLPDLNYAHKMLKKMFVVQQTTYTNLTTRFANVVLPTCSWAEHSGSFTNAESRVRWFNKAIEPLYNSKPNWLIVKELARYFGKSYNYKNEAEILNEIKKNINGYKKLNINSLLNGKSFFVHRLIKFKRYHPVEFMGVEERTSRKYPLVLTIERTMHHFCTGEATRCSSILSKLEPEPLCFISKEDACKFKIKNKSFIEIESRVGKLKIKARISTRIPRGLLVVPFHFEEALANKLVPLDFGPVAEEPNLKRVAVRVRKV